MTLQALVVAARSDLPFGYTCWIAESLAVNTPWLVLPPLTPQLSLYYQFYPFGCTGLLSDLHNGNTRLVIDRSPGIIVEQDLSYKTPAIVLVPALFATVIDPFAFVATAIPILAQASTIEPPISGSPSHISSSNTLLCCCTRRSHRGCCEGPLALNIQQSA